VLKCKSENAARLFAKSPMKKKSGDIASIRFIKQSFEP